MDEEGVCLHDWESVICAQGCGQQVAWGQRCSKPNQAFRVATVDAQLNCGIRKANYGLQVSCGCLAGHACMSVHEPVLPQNPASVHLMAAVSMQMYSH
eukprot:1138963-Pelagomonas_calceolata.AAC.4